MVGVSYTLPTDGGDARFNLHFTSAIPPHRAIVASRRGPCYALARSIGEAWRAAAIGFLSVKYFNGLGAAPAAARLNRSIDEPVSGDLASTSGVAGRYASALFELAEEAGSVDAIETDLKALQAAIGASPDFRDFLKSPVYDAADQMSAISALAEKAGYNVMTANFLKLVAQNRRLFALESVISAFSALAAKARGEISAQAISAAALNDEQTKALRHEIERQVGRAVNLETRVDPDLLGGLIVKIGSQMIDASLKTKLNRLKTVMKEA